jgi:NAD(P)-dependent dehydrogenase (short-subunit alcohol dehydrogenase family)
VIDFSGQVAIVTGAGRGLGRLYALDLARRGASVVVNDVGGSMRGDGADPSVAEAVVAEIEGAGGTAVASHHSVDGAEGGEATVRTALERFGRLDAIVSNAGIFGSVPFDQLSPGDWRRMLGVHLDGGFYLSQPAFRAMKAQGYGRFVFIASSAGLSVSRSRRTTPPRRRGSWASATSSRSRARLTGSLPTPCSRSATPGW